METAEPLRAKTRIMSQRSVFLATACLLILCSCAHQYESDKSDPNYQQGYHFQPPSDAAGAVAGIVASGIALASNRDYYKSTAITGQCVCRNSRTDSIEFPCSGDINVIIADSNGHQLSKSHAYRGEFAFRVQKNTPYKIRATSDKYEMLSTSPPDSFLGDNITIHLVRK